MNSQQCLRYQGAKSLNLDKNSVSRICKLQCTVQCFIFEVIGSIPAHDIFFCDKYNFIITVCIITQPKTK